MAQIPKPAASERKRLPRTCPLWPIHRIIRPSGSGRLAELSHDGRPPIPPGRQRAELAPDYRKRKRGEVTRLTYGTLQLLTSIFRVPAVVA